MSKKARVSPLIAQRFGGPGHPAAPLALRLNFAGTIAISILDEAELAPGETG